MMPGLDEQGSKREVSQEIADLKRIEKDLHHRNQQLHLLITVTHHDMRNKILAMQGYLDLARNETLNEESIASLFENLEGATREIQSQIEFVTIYQNHEENRPTWHQLVDLLPTRSIPSTIQFQTDLDGIEVYSDPLLEKVFANLLDNSIRHGKRVTSVRVSSVKSVDKLVIVWEDDGVGILSRRKRGSFNEAMERTPDLERS
jgi:signal transduction histidine kinase